MRGSLQFTGIDSKWVTWVDNRKYVGVLKLYMQLATAVTVSNAVMGSHRDTEIQERSFRAQRGLSCRPAKKQKKCLVEPWILHKVVKKRLRIIIAVLHLFLFLCLSHTYNQLQTLLRNKVVRAIFL